MDSNVGKELKSNCMYYLKYYYPNLYYNLFLPISYFIIILFFAICLNVLLTHIK